MTDNRLVPHQTPRLPAISSASIPSLPSSSGALALSRTSRARKDAEYTRAYADWLRAQAANYKAAKEASDARYELAVAVSKWQSLGEVCDHEYRKAYLSRTSELKVLALELETRELNARIARDQAMLTLAAFQPQPPPPPAPAAAHPSPPPPPPHAVPVGLTPGEIDEMLAKLPELSSDTRATISYILNARVREKG